MHSSMYRLSKPKKLIWIKTTRCTKDGRACCRSSSGVKDSGTTSFAVKPSDNGKSLFNRGHTCAWASIQPTSLPWLAQATCDGKSCCVLQAATARVELAAESQVRRFMEGTPSSKVDSTRKHGGLAQCLHTLLRNELGRYYPVRR